MRRPGFSLLEVTIVMALILVTAGVTFPFLGSFRSRETLRTASQDVFQALVRARDRAQTSERGSPWGIEFLSETFVLYAGESYAERQTLYDETRSVSVAISFSGLQEVTFRKGSGTPFIAGSLTLTHTTGATSTIVINDAGNISFQMPPPTTCGNGSIETGEDCDGTNLGEPTATCSSISFDGGTLACSRSCTFATAHCTNSEMPLTCGDGNRTVDTGESCDGTNLNGQSCTGLGFGGGTLSCTPVCTVRTASCTNVTAPSTCGNSALESGESCDGTLNDGETCTSLGFDGGTIGCTTLCTVLTAGCTNASAPQTCGNGIVDAGETCDGTLNKTCMDLGLGFDRGTLTCVNCAYDTQQCITDAPPSSCGDGILDAGENCDGENLNGQSCEALGFGGGTLGCTDACAFSTANCTNSVAPATCGNGTVDPGESCDGADINGQTCIDLGFDGGELGCTNDCTYYTANCTNGTQPPTCGDGTIDPGESCIGTNLNGETCTSLGFDSGSLSCTAFCGFDTAHCSNIIPPPTCGDGNLDPGESCDGADINGQTCQSQGFESGHLGCTVTCTYDTTQCVNGSAPPTCGDGVVNGGEQCDGADINGATCQSQGFSSGTIDCTPSCTFDTTQCV